MLYVAAKHHSNFLVAEKKLTHYEKGLTEFETPQLRAEYYGASKQYFVGENIALNFYLTRLDNNVIHRDYNSLATDVAAQWVASKGHFENIITKEYDVTGLAISINRENRSIFIVQKFANILYNYQFKENGDFFSYSIIDPKEPITSFDNVDHSPHLNRHAWKIKSPKPGNEETSNEIINQDNKILRIEPIGKKIRVSTSGVSHLSQLINKRRDGLAIEFVRYESYACGNPEYYTAQSRRNSQCEFSGIVSKPIYRKKLRARIKYNYWSTLRKSFTTDSVLKSFINSFTPLPKKHFKINLAESPTSIAGLFESNLVYLNKKEVVRVRHLTDVCGEKIKPHPDPTLYLPIKSDTIKLKIPKVDSTYRFYFKKGSSQYNFDEIKESLFPDVEEYILKEIKILAFSSIEGSEQINRKLQQERAQSLLSAIQSRQESSPKTSIQTESNWDFFSTQIKNDSNLKFLKDWDKDRQKRYIDSAMIVPHGNKALDILLDSQRYAQIQIKANYNYTRFKLRLFEKEYKRLIKELNNKSKNSTASYIIDGQLTKLLSSVFIEINSKNLNPSLLLSFKPPYKKSILSSLIQYTSMCYKLGLAFENEPWSKLEKLITIKMPNPRFEVSVIRRNAIVETIISIGSDSIALANKSTYLKGKLELVDKQHIPTTFDQDSMHTKLYLNVLNERELMESSGIYDLATNFIFSRFNTPKTSEVELLKVAELFVFIERYDLAYSLLQPRIDLENPYLPIISLFTKLGYQNSIEFPTSQYGQWLKTIHPLYPKNEWCGLFVGPCNISFQVFDDESVRDLYCQSCGDYKNYAIQILEEEDNEVK